MKNKIKYFIVFVLVCIFMTIALPFNLFADTKSEVSAFVTRFYQLCLSREPDPSGLHAWTDFLMTGQKTGAQVAHGFIYSPEFMSKNVTNHDYLIIMYRSFFDREPDPMGYSGWLNSLNSGYSRQYVLAGFVNSQEFKDLSDRFGIIAGTLNPGNPKAEIKTPASKIIGSTYFIENVHAALGLLMQYDPDVYNQYANVSKIQEADLRAFSASGVANTKGEIYIDYTYGHIGYADIPKVMELALTLSHEFNHIMHISSWNSLPTVELERLAINQELNTARKIGVNPSYIAYLEWVLANIYNPSIWWWRGISASNEGAVRFMID
jgi:hypothetical protein